jgi:uncharacterized protein YjbI with pentapeptide repeats
MNAIFLNPELAKIDWENCQFTNSLFEETDLSRSDLENYKLIFIGL